MALLQLQTSDGRPLILNARRESTVIMKGNDTSYTFDYAGRLVGAYRSGRNYRRSFANEILEKQSGAHPGLSGRVRRVLGHDEVRALETEAYDFAGSVLGELRQRQPSAEPHVLDAIKGALDRVNSYCYTGLERERELYQRIYHPVTILPPDQYLALYLQMTEGCAYNQCAFCGFYHDRRFHVKTPELFHEHIRRVRAFVGDGLSLRRSIFVGDANALMLSQHMLLPRFDLINQEFAIEPRGVSQNMLKAWRAEHPIHFNGIYSFIDAFTTKQKRAADYRALAERGLRRVYVGLESGAPELLEFLSKPNTPDDVVHLVNECKAGGVAVGVIILVGAGGDKYEPAHIERTTRLVNSLPLDETDLVYLSELIDFPGSSYSQRAAEEGIKPLDLDAIQNQMNAMRGGFRFDDGRHAPRVSAYDVREFVY